MSRGKADEATYRPALCLSDASRGDVWIHMGRKVLTGEVAACGAPVWCFGSAFNPGYSVCVKCIEAAGYDPRTPAAHGKLF